MNEPIFAVISVHDDFRNLLSNALNELGDCLTAKTSPLHIPTSVQIIFVDQNLVPHVQKLTSSRHIVEIVFFNSEEKVKTVLPHFFAVHKRADLVSVAADIARVVQGTGFHKSRIYIPDGIELSGDVKASVVVVPAHKVASTLSPQAAAHRQKRRRINFKFPKKYSPKATAIKPLLFVFLISMWILFLPFVSLALASLSALLAVKSVSSLSFTQAVIFVKATKVLSSFTGSTAETLAYLPVVSSPMKYVAKVGSFELESASLFEDGLKILTSVTASPTVETLKEVSPSFDKFTRDAMRLDALSHELPIVAQLIPSFRENEDSLKYLPLLNTLISRAPVLLGENTPSSIMVLFQNNMELRPTGGFLGSFALFGINKGKASNYKIYDVYDADGQLTGYIAPPSPIKNYLGEASWHMRDSNWDPDFAVSAQRVGWFLDKTLNTQADVVVGVNLTVLHDLLSVVGPVKVIDYNDTIDATNFYQKIQGEVHANFFPGTRKKSNYLTAVANGVLTKILTTRENWGALLKTVVHDVDSKDIEVYFKDSLSQDSAVTANAAGTVGENSIGFVEANVGVNKANQFIERSGGVAILKKDSVQMTATLKLKNTAAAVSDETRYRVYLRSFAPKGFTSGRVEVTSGGVLQSMLPEVTTLPNRVEAGVFFEVKAGESATAVFSWGGEVPQGSGFTFWKQSGVLPYTLSVQSTLTDGATSKYNTLVSKDLFIRI